MKTPMMDLIEEMGPGEVFVNRRYLREIRGELGLLIGLDMGLDYEEIPGVVGFLFTTSTDADVYLKDNGLDHPTVTTVSP